MEDEKNGVFNALTKAFQDPAFLQRAGWNTGEQSAFIRANRIRIVAARLIERRDEKGRFRAADVVEIAKAYISYLHDEPPQGWLAYIYQSLLHDMFPHSAPDNGDGGTYRMGMYVLLQLLRGLYHYEYLTIPFDPCKNMALLRLNEATHESCGDEYNRMRKLIQDKYIYEFMRIGIEITPFNTLGHVGGVHYVALFMARQLQKAGVPVDTALASGAAACHDMGKYGCKKDEERRVPYLHYYYTGTFCRRFDLNQIGHIAANHSVWDLELENLSVESLLLIYADFRVKSTRDAEGEHIHFYTLAQAFDVILGKLDNVDEAKKARYQKVYAKLADFERFMKERGVITDLPADFAPEPKVPKKPIKREFVLLEGPDVVDQLKYAAIDHNIRLMSLFRDESDFGRLIEGARSQQSWKDVRTYVSIFEEYSTYMTEHQKLMTLKFLYELLSHKEVDIRMQAASLMGHIVANFNDKYTKELPKGVTLPDKTVTNTSLFSRYISMIIEPDVRYTERHKLLIGYCLSAFLEEAMVACTAGDRPRFLTTLRRYYTEPGNYDDERVIILLKAAYDLDFSYFDRDFIERAQNFATKARELDNLPVQIMALRCLYHLQGGNREDYYNDLLDLMDLPRDEQAFADREGHMFLVDLKFGTHWVVKVANMDLMVNYCEKHTNGMGNLIHLGMHLTNLLKVSETLFARRVAGKSLLRIAKQMTYSQRNELAVELFNGLEIGDPQISKYMPDFLGAMIIQLPVQEFDELIITLEQQLSSVNTQLAASMVHTLGVVLEHFQSFDDAFGRTTDSNDQRKLRLLYLMIKAYAHYDKELSRDAFRDLGRFVFSSNVMSLDEKDFLFLHCYKKLLVLLHESEEGTLDFYSNAAVLNHIYRYIGTHEFVKGAYEYVDEKKACFYPGTFDPFSLGHKAVARKIRDLGFDVYLALDEFSWSKHTQPRLMRRKIMNMSVADEENMYPFPDDLPVNIANPKDIKRLKEVFEGKDLYIAVGTDVIEHASAYRQAPGPNTIHSLNHIAFDRETDEHTELYDERSHMIEGQIISLKLDKFYEDISSTKIRENIDLNRDISNLIDAAAQNFIYDNNLYLREPAYKHVLEAQEIGIGAFKPRGAESLWPLMKDLWDQGYNTDIIDRYIEKDEVWTLYIDDAGEQREMIAYSAVHSISSRHLLREFQDASIAAHIRNDANGKIAIIGFLFSRNTGSIDNVSQIVITEILSELISRDYTYAVYHPVDDAGYDKRITDALQLQGFVDIAPEGSVRPVFVVDMKSPIVIFRDVETTVKNPFNKNPRVRHAISMAHNNLLSVMNCLYPGQLLLSFNMSAVHHKIINKVAEINGVSTVEDKQKRRGPYMSVPFGKALSNVLVPNTVTKELHIDKYFNRTAKGFTIAETRQYSSVDNQVRTIKSFDRPIILIDDLLHKGHRMNMLTPYLRKNGIDIKEALVGVMTGAAMDMMEEKSIHAEAVYFVPTLKVWLNERDCYPFIGGDSIYDDYHRLSGYDRNPSINLVLPYVKPAFIKDGDDESAFLYSLTCLQNAALIMETLQDVYQETFERRLTLKRLGEVIMYPRIPDIDYGVHFDENMDPATFIHNNIEQLIRLRWGEISDDRSHADRREDYDFLHP